MKLKSHLTPLIHQKRKALNMQLRDDKNAIKICPNCQQPNKFNGIGLKYYSNNMCNWIWQLVPIIDNNQHVCIELL